jgi:hypothetical protein
LHTGLHVAKQNVGTIDAGSIMVNISDPVDWLVSGEHTGQKTNT